MEKALIDASLNGNAIYAKDAEKAIDLCMAGLLLTLMTTADVTEDDVSIKIPDRAQLLKVYKALLGKWGEVDPTITPEVKPTVTQRLLW
nr:DUF6706 family protein [Pedobacter sp. SG908]